jgi:hypothetical protein
MSSLPMPKSRQETCLNSDIRVKPWPKRMCSEGGNVVLSEVGNTILSDFVHASISVDSKVLSFSCDTFKCWKTEPLHCFVLSSQYQALRP